MRRYMLFATAVGLLLGGVTLRADETKDNTGGVQPPSLEAPQAPDAPAAPPRPDAEQPVTAPDRPALDTPVVPNPPEQPPQQPVVPQPDQPVTPQPEPAPPIQERQDPVQPHQPRPETQPAPMHQVDTGGMAVQLSPLQEFVSHQNHEIGMLSRQMDVFKAAKRNDVVMAMFHMIRDHTLVSDAAQNVLARRGELSRPFPVMMAEPMAQSPDEIIDQQLKGHEQHLAMVQERLANAPTPEERSIYERDQALVNKHLNWLRALDQGRQLQIGFFGPTVPLARIAGYREESSAGQARRNGNQTRRTRRPR